MLKENNKSSIIEFEDFSYYYQNSDVPALDSLKLKINKGDFVGIIGKNKAGKSTTCLAMMGIAPHIIGGDWIGEVKINGQVIDQENVIDVTKTIGIVFQDAESQFTQETIEDEIAFAMCNLGISTEQMVERVEEAIKSCDLDELKGRSPFQLSGGQQQRLAVACLLALKPEVIILDESTSQLDPIGRDEVFNLVKNLHQEGSTIIMVDHNIEKIAQYTNKLLVLYDGKLKYFDETKAVLQHKAQLNKFDVRLPQVTDAAYKLNNIIDFEDLPITLEQAVKDINQKKVGID